eukprot:scaffold470_cov257-Pinguiococcus_pyrenoidosus.AAC.31
MCVTDIGVAPERLSHPRGYTAAYRRAFSQRGLDSALECKRITPTDLEWRYPRLLREGPIRSSIS